MTEKKSWAGADSAGAIRGELIAAVMEMVSSFCAQPARRPVKAAEDGPETEDESEVGPPCSGCG